MRPSLSHQDKDLETKGPMHKVLSTKAKDLKK